MKKILLLTTLIGGALLTSSCEDNLFQEPQTSKVLNSFLRNETETVRVI